VDSDSDFNPGPVAPEPRKARGRKRKVVEISAPKARSRKTKRRRADSDTDSGNELKELIAISSSKPRRPPPGEAVLMISLSSMSEIDQENFPRTILYSSSLVRPSRLIWVRYLNTVIRTPWTGQPRRPRRGRR
jgi:hypothetical protein